MIAAGETADGFTVHRAHGIATQQHCRDQAHLVDVVALLPPSHFAPRDLVRNAEDVERVSGDTAATELVGRDAEVAQLQLLAFADEDVERREIAVQSLSLM